MPGNTATQPRGPDIYMNLAFVIEVKITVAALSSFEALGSVLI